MKNRKAERPTRVTAGTSRVDGPPRPAATTDRSFWVQAPSSDMTGSDDVLSLFVRCRDSLDTRGGPPATALVVDLRLVRAADTKLAACLVAIFRVADAAHVPVETRCSPLVEELLKLCRLERLAAPTGDDGPS